MSAIGQRVGENPRLIAGRKPFGCQARNRVPPGLYNKCNLSLTFPGFYCLIIAVELQPSDHASFRAAEQRFHFD